MTFSCTARIVADPFRLNVKVQLFSTNYKDKEHFYATEHQGRCPFRVGSYSSGDPRQKIVSQTLCLAQTMPDAALELGLDIPVHVKPAPK